MSWQEMFSSSLTLASSELTRVDPASESEGSSDRGSVAGDEGTQQRQERKKESKRQTT